LLSTPSAHSITFGAFQRTRYFLLFSSQRSSIADFPKLAGTESVRERGKQWGNTMTKNWHFTHPPL
jgi:hypothetical protein